MELKPFLELVRRASKSKFNVFLMHNRMMMQCYTVDEDSDVGMHYILHIPDSEPYTDELYDRTLLINASEFLSLYKEGHEKLSEKKKLLGAKPKEVKEELHFNVHGKIGTLSMSFIVQDDIVCTKKYDMMYPVSNIDPNVERILSTYQNIFDRIRPGGLGVAIDGFRHGLMDRALDSPEIIYFKVKLGNQKVRVPIYKSLFNGQKSYDEFFFSVQETVLPAIYMYTVQLARKGLIEQFIGYILAF